MRRVVPARRSSARTSEKTQVWAVLECLCCYRIRAVSSHTLRAPPYPPSSPPPPRCYPLPALCMPYHVPFQLGIVDAALPVAFCPLLSSTPHCSLLPAGSLFLDSAGQRIESSCAIPQSRRSLLERLQDGPPWPASVSSPLSAPIASSTILFTILFSFCGCSRSRLARRAIRGQWEVSHHRSSLLLHHLPMLSVPRISHPQRDIRCHASHVGGDSCGDGEAVLDVMVVRVFARIGQALDGVWLERTRP